MSGVAEPVRVLIVAHNAVAESNRRRVEALAALPGVQVILLSPAWWDEEGRRVAADRSQARGFCWHVGQTLATGNGTRYLYLSHLAALVRRVRPHVIDVHEEPFSFAALQAVATRRLWAPGAAVAFYSAVNVHRQWRWPYRAAERLVLRHADAAYAPHSEVGAILRAKGFQGPIATLPLGVDFERFATAAAMPLPDWPRPLIAFLGRLEPVKGVDVLLRAFQACGRSGTLLIAGDGSERGRLERLAGELGLTTRVQFLSSIPFGQVPGLLRAVDALVLPSITLLPLHREQFGRVVAEAMATGTPVLTSNSGALPDVVGEAGRVVPEGDVPALATALRELLDDPGVRARLAELGRQRARAEFAWDVVARRTLDEVYAPAREHRRRVLGGRAA